MSSQRVYRVATSILRPRIALRLSQPAAAAGRLSTDRLVASPFTSTTTTFGSSRAYSSDQTISPFARSVITTTRVFRNLLLVSTSTLALTYFVWSGTHAYLEQYKCPSPQGVSKQVQDCLHGAWVREEFAPDPEVAEMYLQTAIELTRKDLETRLQQRNQQQQQQRDGELILELEKDKALVEIYNRLARFYGRIGRDEQAATLWTRLWKLSEKEITGSPSEASSESGSGSGLGSLFGGASQSPRPLVTAQDGIPFAKSAADCWMRLGEYDLAEEALGWTLSVLKKTTTPTSTSSIEEIGLLSKLGALYVHQAKFDYALSLFVKALQMVQEHRTATRATAAAAKATNNNTSDEDMWYCREAILKHSIGETLYGAATADGTFPSPVKSKQQQQQAEESKKSSSSWKFWSSSSTPTPSPASGSMLSSVKSPEQKGKEEEALGWMQQAIEMAKEKSGQHRDCDECAALALNNLGLIHEVIRYLHKKKTPKNLFTLSIHSHSLI